MLPLWLHDYSTELLPKALVYFITVSLHTPRFPLAPLRRLDPVESQSVLIESHVLDQISIFEASKHGIYYGSLTSPEVKPIGKLPVQYVQESHTDR